MAGKKIWPLLCQLLIMTQPAAVQKNDGEVALIWLAKGWQDSGKRLVNIWHRWRRVKQLR
jgi:hypothetical protein